MSSNKFIARNGLAVGTTPVDIVDANGTILVNSPTAAKLQTARTISLSGDVAGSVSFDGSGNVDISTTIQADSVALGTDTTGNYVATIGVSGTGLSVSGSGTETAAVTITSNATSSNTISTIVARDASGNFSAGTITAALSGNASTASSLQTARTIALTGDVTGSVSFDGSGNVDISTTVQPNSVALGTDTTGNYMVNVSAGTGVSVSHVQGEGSTATVSIGQAVGTTDNVIFNNVTVNGTLTSDDITSTSISITGDATITGNLTVSGTTTTVNSTTVALADLNLELARNATNAAQANGAGITVTGPTTPATLTYTSADDRWNFNKNLNVGTVYGALSGNASTASAWQTARTETLSGDVTGSASVDGSAGWTITTTLANSGVTAGSYGSSTSVPVITVDAKGRVTSVSTSSISGSLTFTGDVTGTGSTGSSTTLTLANTAVTAGSYGSSTQIPSITVDSKGRITAASNNAITVGAGTLGVSIGTAGATNTTVTWGTSSGFTANTSSNYTYDLKVGPALTALATLMTSGSTGFIKRTGVDTYSIDTNTYLTGNQTITISGDASGSGTTSIALTLANSGVTAGTYNNVTVNAKGLVTSGSNVSYLTSYTETDTLATVTGRGATTSTVTSFTGGGGDGLPALRITQTASATTANWLGSFINSGLSGAAGKFGLLLLGQAESAKNSGYLGFQWQGAGSNSNAVTLGLYAADNLLRVYGGGYTEMSGSARAPIFYDSDNTAYYCDPNSRSNLSTLNTGGATIASGMLNVYNGGAGGVGWGTGFNMGDSSNYTSWIQDGGIDRRRNYGTGGWDWYNSGGSRSYWGDNSGNSYASTSFRAPIFYDSDNTAYYTDPASTSQLNYVVAQNLIDSAGTRFTNPAGGSYTSSSGTITGAFKIKLPADRNNSSTMVQFGVTIYEYSTGQTHQFRISGYNYGGGNWYNWAATQLTDGGRGALTIRWGYDGTSDCVWIGETNTSWSYPQVFVTDVQAGYSGLSNNWGAGWSISLVTAFDTVEQSRTASLVKTANNASNWGFADYGTIWYDTNNTGYYVDPAGSARLNTIYCGDVYNDNGGWFRNYNTTGIYNQTYSNHWYATSSAYWNLAGTNNSYCGIVFRPEGHQSTVRGYVYADTSNNIGFLNSSGNWKFRVVGADYSLIEGSSIRAPIFYDSDNTSYYLDANSTGTSLNVAGSITAAGNVTAYSDIRIKTNIRTIENAIDKVKLIRGVTFDRIDNPDAPRQTGVIAQEVKEVLPEAVFGDELTQYTVAYGNMVGLLIEAIKEQQSEIDELKALVKQLLAK